MCHAAENQFHESPLRLFIEKQAQPLVETVFNEITESLVNFFAFSHRKIVAPNI